jgi:hypothetical protein
MTIEVIFLCLCQYSIVWWHWCPSALTALTYCRMNSYLFFTCCRGYSFLLCGRHKKQDVNRCLTVGRVDLSMTLSSTTTQIHDSRSQYIVRGIVTKTDKRTRTVNKPKHGQRNSKKADESTTSKAGAVVVAFYSDGATLAVKSWINLFCVLLSGSVSRGSVVLLFSTKQAHRQAVLGDYWSLAMLCLYLSADVLYCI